MDRRVICHGQSQSVNPAPASNPNKRLFDETLPFSLSLFAFVYSLILKTFFFIRVLFESGESFFFFILGFPWIDIGYCLRCFWSGVVLKICRLCFSIVRGTWVSFYSAIDPRRECLRICHQIKTWMNLIPSLLRLILLVDMEG